MSRKILVLSICLVLALSISAEAETYQATVNAHNAPITVEVTMNGSTIEKVEVIRDFETIGIGKVAIPRMTSRIAEAQSLAVDMVSGATVTSYAIISGVDKALKDAGIDTSPLKAKKDKAAPEDKTYTTDVAIVGGGGAGLAAAISATENGANVIVIEKLDILGGSTNISEGALNAVDPERQGKQGIEDSIEKFITQTYEGGHRVGNMTLIKYMCENALSSVHWLESIGVHFKDEVGTATGALWQRSHYTTTPSGNSYIRVFEDYAAKHDNLTVLTGTTVEELLTEGKRVVGVSAKRKDGGKVIVKAKSVILATGGFGANKALLKKYNTGVWAHVDLTTLGCTNMAKSATGAGIEMGEKIGAAVTGMSDIQVHPCGTPGTGLMENIRTSGRNRLFVNLEGNRFVNEGAARDVLAQAVFDQKGQTYWIVVNVVRYPSRDWVDANGATIANMVAQGSVIEADTLDELAAKIDVNAENLKAAVDGYNAVVRGEKTDEFGFVANNKADTQLTSGPWYACKKVPTVHHTMGGLEIDVDTHVLDTEGEVIPGLYAAGEVTGGIHGSNRLGGNAIADCMTYGRKAGEFAAKNK